MREVRAERTAWRCQDISERHRNWGWDCPAVDLDFVLLEYNWSEPVAVVEYKHKNAATPDVTRPTYQALKRLADGYCKGAIPFFVTIYCPELWWFQVIPVNDSAAEYYRHVLDEKITEQRYVRSLYLLRKKVLSAEDEKVLSGLADNVPDDAVNQQQKGETHE